MTELGSVSGASDVIADHYIFAIFVAVSLHEIPLPFCLYLEFRLANCEAWDEFTNPRENRPNKMAKEITFKAAQISRLPGDFPVFHIYIYSHSKEKMAMWNINDLTCARDRLRSFIFSPRNARSSDMSDLLPCTSSIK